MTATTEIITLCIRLAIAVMCGIIAPLVKRWLEAKAENAKMDRIKQAAETAVYAAEQMLKSADPDGTQRYDFAVRAIVAASHKIGITLTPDEIKMIIEAAVQEINIYKGGGIELGTEATEEG